METANTDVIQGTLDMLILKTLSLEPMHGFGIARRVEQISRGVFKVNPGFAAHGAEPAGTRWMARRRMASDRELSTCQVLHVSLAPGRRSSTSKHRTGRVGYRLSHES